MPRRTKLLAVGLTWLIAAGTPDASSEEIEAAFLRGPLVPSVQETRLYHLDVAGLGLDSVQRIVLTDDDDAQGGGQGVFSGFDLDGVFLDRDGRLDTVTDRYFATSYRFIAGTTRPPQGPGEQPTPNHPGPNFGALSATEIDHGTATLDTFDGAFGGADNITDVALSHGYLSLGDGGRLTVEFYPAIDVADGLSIFIGDVADNEQLVGLTITVSSTPEPAAWVLGLVIALAGLVGRRASQWRTAAGKADVEC